MSNQNQPAPRPVMRMTRFGEVSDWARAAFETAQFAYARGDNDEALKALKRALDADRDFVDAHLWIGLLSADPDEKRDHLGEVIARDPGNLDALRELMVLNGRLTPEQAAQTYHVDDAKQVRVEGAVKTTTEVLRCPSCGGDLTIDDASGRVTCKFCGYSAARPRPGGVASDMLGMALLERKAQPVRWKIAERLLHCHNCGAERTLTASHLSLRCPFCGSNHIIEQDALASFEQPDGLIPFKLDERAAINAVRERLNSVSERFVGLFEENRVARGVVEGIYVPFWVYNALVQITETRHDRRAYRQSSAANWTRAMMQMPQPYTTTTYPDGAHDVAVCAVTKLSPALAAQISAFIMSEAVPYAPELLAKYPAALYDIDFDKGALEARSVIARIMRDKHGHDDSGDVTVTITSAVQTMDFQLVLMPVWVLTLTERDGDIRPALVNGQTGQAALGHAKKSG